MTVTRPIDSGPPTNRGSAAVVAALAGRGLIRMRRLPSIAIPMVVMPVFFVVAFSGSFAAAVQIEGYGTDKAVNFMAAWAALQGAAFAGVGAGGVAATDLENGFFDRLRMAPVAQASIVGGLLGYSLARSLLPVTAVLAVAFALLDADMPGGLLGLLMVYLSSLGVAIVMSLAALSLVFTLKTFESIGLVQIFIFSLMFLSVGQAPLVAIEGWLHAVATINPMTRIIQMARQGFLGDVTWAATWPGLVALGAMIAFFTITALWRLHKVTG